MQRLYRKRIVLGVGGGIAAYKSAELVRRLIDQGAEVRVVMTRGGSEFITPLTMQALSGHPVHLDLLDPAAEAAMGHIELAKWADMVLIAPATADLIARLAQGIADDLLTTLVLATDATVAIAPAMNQAMWRDPATQANTQLLQSRGLKVFGPASGSQACGDVGLGRGADADQTIKHLLQSVRQRFIGQVLVGEHGVAPDRRLLDAVHHRCLSRPDRVGKIGVPVLTVIGTRRQLAVHRLVRQQHHLVVLGMPIERLARIVVELAEVAREGDEALGARAVGHRLQRPLIHADELARALLIRIGELVVNKRQPPPEPNATRVINLSI